MQAPQAVKTILVVDDDPEWRGFICEALGKDYAVRVAIGGEDGIRVASECRPCLIVLDVMMPDGPDGFSTLCGFKSNPATKDIPVVMFSEINTVTDADFNQEILAQYLGTPPEVFLEKPVTPERLLQEVSRLLNGDG